MSDEPPIRYEAESSPFRFSYFEGWSLRETDGAVSLWRSREGGAITISSMNQADRVHALEQCRRLAEKAGLDLPRVAGDAAEAEAVFDVPGGGWCKARVLARGSRLLLATYTVERDDRLEEDQADRILASVTFTPLSAGPSGAEDRGTGPLPRT